MSGACRRLWMQETVVNRFSSVFLLLTRSPTWLLVLALRNINVGLKICCWFLFYRPCCSQLGNPSLLVRRRDRNSHGIDVVVFLCCRRMYKQATVASCSYRQQVTTMIPFPLYTVVHFYKQLGIRVAIWLYGWEFAVLSWDTTQWLFSPVTTNIHSTCDIPWKDCLLYIH